MIYRSERLNYREFTENDFHLFYSVFSNEQVMRYALIEKFNCEEDILPYFKKVLKNNITIENRNAYEFAVFLTSDDSFIGFADIEIHNKNNLGGCGEIGYFLIPSFWGNGYATEISNLLSEICFKHINLHRVAARCNSNNLQSEKIMKKVGMTKEGEFRRVRFKNGEWENEQHYSILLDEWEQSCSEMSEIVSF
ncbi:N-acetyltransferase [Paenibacillus psychroresistens]|uniref:N-acetyltransferase n=1 Tax=Paenibacillus psychroresistens TaxID=1778678 RepID=A0A6B8RJX9_9BACL|nr:GNAT family protein [Paenibacillus psychroresistens]QGQ96590.1 N-acetyltransferase [Paenibacillus psychroresistens]